jgi:hypothetical protein
MGLCKDLQLLFVLQAREMPEEVTSVCEINFVFCVPE